jgi:hypothetical protein
MLPTPLRIMGAVILSAMRLTTAHEEMPAIVLVLVGQAHALAFHAPSTWSPRVHRQSCTQLTEHILYYGAVQILLIESLAVAGSGAELAACYCGLYYAWSVCKHALAMPHSTLAPYCIVLSLVVYALLIVPAFHYHYGKATSGDTHLLAWTVADVSHYTMTCMRLIHKFDNKPSI